MSKITFRFNIHEGIQYQYVNESFYTKKDTRCYQCTQNTSNNYRCCVQSFKGEFAYNSSYELMYTFYVTPTISSYDETYLIL